MTSIERWGYEKTLTPKEIVSIDMVEGWVDRWARAVSGGLTMEASRLSGMISDAGWIPKIGASPPTSASVFALVPKTTPKPTPAHLFRQSQANDF